MFTAVGDSWLVLAISGDAEKPPAGDPNHHFPIGQRSVASQGFRAVQPQRQQRGI